MTRRLLAAALLVGAAWVGVLAPAAVGGAPACASGGPHAALVVATGTGAPRAYCVALDAPEVSGLHLIVLAHEQHGLSYAFGNGGLAICQLAGVGPSGSDCFADYPDYWGYWHGNGSGGWTWASTGAGSASIGDGDVDAWSWGTGDTAATHPVPPGVRIDDVCTPAPAPSPSPSPAATGTAAVPPPSGGAGTATGTSPPGAGSGSAKPTRSPERSPSGSPSRSDGDPSVVVVAGGLTAPPAGGGGPPAGLLLAGVLAAALVIGGLYRVRRRAARPGTGL